MKMKKIMKIVGWVAFASTVLVVLGFANSRYTSLITKEPIVEIIKPDNHNFVSVDNVKMILNDLGYDFINQQMQDIELQRIEDELEQLAGVKSAEVYKYNTGEVKIHIQQQLPIARIIYQNGLTGCYLDNEGKFIPLSSEYVAKVPVFNGFIYEPAEDITTIDQISTTEQSSEVLTIGNIYLLASKLNEDEFFKSQIVQVYVNNRNEFELIPRVGNQRILLGNLDAIESKLYRLKSFYTSGTIDIRELNLYDTLNLKFANQLVATKKLKQ